jgi:putative spermidine/putrescine transport system permease protein
VERIMIARNRSSALLGIYVCFMSFLIVAPIGVVLISALSAEASIAFPPHELSLQWFRQVLTDSQWRTSLKLSLEIGTMTAVFATLIGLLAALGLRAMRGPLAAALQTLFMSPLMLPTILIGLALLQVFQSMHMSASIMTVALGHILIACPYVIRLVLTSFAGMDPTVERAALSLGASPYRVFTRVTFPLIRHGILAGALFSFIVSLDDVNLALFLSDVRTTPLPVQLFSYIEQNADPLGAAVATVLVLVAAILMFICDRIVGIEWLFGIKQRSA